MESGQQAVEVATAPGTRRCFWLGQEAEQSRRSSEQAAGGTEETDEEVDEEDDEDADEQLAPAGNFEARTVTVTPRVAEAQAGGATQPTRKKSIPAHVGDYPWLRCFAPGHPMTQTEAPEEAQIVLLFLKTRGIFEARFSTPAFPANFPKGMRLHQATRTCTVVGRVTEHEACRQVLLWIWQKFAVTKPNVGPLPDPVAVLLGERKHARLEPCRACADGTCRAMARGSRLAQMWKAMMMKANAVPPQVSVRVLLQGSGASQPTAEPRAEVTPCAGAGDSLFIALSFAKVVCCDRKEWPELEDVQMAQSSEPIICGG